MPPKLEAKKRFRIHSSALCALGCLLALAGTAAAQLGPIEEVSGGTSGVEPRVVVDPEGNTFAMWPIAVGTGTSWQLAIRPLDGAWGAPQGDPQNVGWANIEVGFDASSNAIFAWTPNFGGGLKTAFRSAGAAGSFGSVQNIVSDQDDFDLSVSPTGDALLTWTDDNGVWAAFRPAGAGGLFGTPQQIGTTRAFPYAILDPDGAAVVIWRESPVAQSFVQVTQDAGAGDVDFSEPGDAIDTMAQIIQDVAMASNAAGDAVLTWTARTDASAWDVWASVRAPGGTFQAPVRISPLGQWRSSDPRPSVGENGQVGVVFENADLSIGGLNCDARKNRVALSLPPEIGTFQDTVATVRAVEPDLTMLHDGTPLVVWREFQGNPDSGDCGLPVEIKSRLGGVGEALVASSSFGLTALRDPRVGAGRFGPAYTVWEQAVEDPPNFRLVRGRQIPGLGRIYADGFE